MLSADRHLSLPREVVQQGPYHLLACDAQGGVLARGALESCEKGPVRVLAPVTRTGKVASLALEDSEGRQRFMLSVYAAFEQPPQVTADVDSLSIHVFLDDSAEVRRRTQGPQALRLELAQAEQEVRSLKRLLSAYRAREKRQDSIGYLLCGKPEHRWLSGPKRMSCPLCALEEVRAGGRA